jgi:hypothetical protein
MAKWNGKEAWILMVRDKKVASLRYISFSISDRFIFRLKILSLFFFVSLADTIKM